MPGMIQPERETIFLPNGTVMVRVRSMFSGKMNEDCLPVTREEWDRWQSGEYIQIAMPHLTSDQREFLLTGATPQEWEAEFGTDE